jgi:hypothetical protein
VNKPFLLDADSLEAFTFCGVAPPVLESQLEEGLAAVVARRAYFDTLPRTAKPTKLVGDKPKGEFVLFLFGMMHLVQCPYRFDLRCVLRRFGAPSNARFTLYMLGCGSNLRLSFLVT